MTRRRYRFAWMYSTAGMNRAGRISAGRRTLLGTVFDLAEPAAASEIVERRGRFRVADEVDGLDRDLRQIERNDLHTQTADHPQGLFVVPARRELLRCREARQARGVVAESRPQKSHAQFRHVRRGVPPERHVEDGVVLPVRAVDGIEHERAILCRAAHRADGVLRPRQGHRPVSADSPERGPHAGDAVARRRLNDRAARVGPDGKRHQSGSRRRARAGRRARRILLRVPGVPCDAAEPLCRQRECPGRQFRDEDRARLPQPRVHGGVRVDRPDPCRERRPTSSWCLGPRRGPSAQRACRAADLDTCRRQSRRRPASPALAPAPA